MIPPSTGIIDAIASLPNLRRLGLCGELTHDNPLVLGKMLRLESLKLTAPGSMWAQYLVSILARLDARPQGGLTSLKILKNVGDEREGVVC